MRNCSMKFSPLFSYLGIAHSHKIPKEDGETNKSRYSQVFSSIGKMYYLKVALEI